MNKTHSNTVHYTSPNEYHYPLCNTKGLARQLYGSSSTPMPDRSTLNDIQVREINCNIKHLQTAFQNFFKKNIYFNSNVTMITQQSDYFGGNIIVSNKKSM